MLNDKELAAIANRLQIPLVVGDILAGEDALTDDVQFAIHDAISDLQPDTALLCIALSARKIAGIYHNASPGMKIMGNECGRIIEDYGPLWLQNAAHQPVDEIEVLDTLSNIHEDLEYLTELLELNISFLETKDKTAARLCEILLIQTGAHALIADSYLSTLNAAQNDASEIMTVIADKALANDNIVPFPLGTKTR